MRRAWTRAGLLFLAATTTLNGSLWALPFPRSFYEDFPLPGRDWVSTLVPYDEHLVRDYGALNLALSILLVATAIFLERHLTRVALVAWLGYAVPHFVFHTTLVDHFSPSTTWRSWDLWGYRSCSRWSCFWLRVCPFRRESGRRKGMRILRQEKGAFRDEGESELHPDPLN